MSLGFFRKDLSSLLSGKSALVKLKFVLTSHSVHLVFLLRLGHDLGRVPVLGGILRVLIEYFIRVVYASDISCRAKIGPGLVIVHGHDIVIGSDTVIGENCKIFNGVTCGNKDVSGASAGNQPVIGNNVILSTGAKLLGPISVGDNAVIGANSVVVSDVSSNTVVGGVPARFIKARG